MRTIEAGRVTLEPQTAAHADAMFAVLSDPAIYTYENEPPASPEWLRTRFEKLESRRSPDGSEQWLNWVVRLRSSELIGYVQATVLPDLTALIAYEFSSRHWGRGLAREAAEALIGELVDYYHVRSLTAIAKSANLRSLRLLERLRFVPAGPDLLAIHHLEPGEVLVTRPASIDAPAPVSLQPFHAADLQLLSQWLRRSHVAPWYPAPEENVAWAKDPPEGGSQALIACDARPVGYIRWQIVDRTTLDSVGLNDVPAGSVDVDLLLGEPDCLGMGLGPAALTALLERLRANADVPLVGLTTSVANTRAHGAFEKAGFRLLRRYAPPGFGPCSLFVVSLRDPRR